MTDFQLEVSDGARDKVATILPGTGYTVDHMVLALARDALLDAGWTVRALVWDGRPGLVDARRVYPRVVRDAADAAKHAHHLVVGKSLGALALPTCLEMRLPGAWITPPVSADQMPEVRASIERLSGVDLPTLLVGGTRDAQWDGELAARSGATVVELADATHALTIPGDWRATWTGLGEVTAAVETLARRVAP